jgi:hypothetical protein
MREYWRYFWPLLIVLFVITFSVIESLQDAGDVDSIGLWYTIYCAAASICRPPRRSEPQQIARL